MSNNEWKLDRELCQMAAHCIMEGFEWEATKEGGDYWYEVYSKLEELAEEED